MTPQQLRELPSYNNATHGLPKPAPPKPLIFRILEAK